jgi:hypothetical protein
LKPIAAGAARRFRTAPSRCVFDRPKRMNAIDSKELSMLLSEKWLPLFGSMI